MKILPGLCIRISFAILLFSIPAFSAGTDTIFFSMPKVNAFRGDTVRIPVVVSTLLLSDSIYSGYVKLSYDTTVFQLLSIQTDTTMLAGAILVPNLSLKRITFASGVPITGSGVLFKLIGRLLPTANSSSLIKFDSVSLNESNFNIVSTNGEINPLDRLPQFINVLNDTSVVEKDSIALSFKAFDPDGDPIKYFLESPIKDTLGVFFDTLNGTFAWRPQLFHQGIYFIHVKAIDDRGGFSFANVNLTVENLNQNPQIIFFPDTIFRQENSVIKDTVAAFDLDFDILSFSLVNAPAGMSINPAGSNQNIFRAEILWSPGFNQAGTYPVTLNVIDNNGGGTSKAILFQIADVNRSPAFTLFPRDITIKENTLVTMIVQALDPDGDEIIYGLSGAPFGMMIDSLAGKISWVPNSSQAGIHHFEVSVGDKKGPPTKAAVTFTVDNTNGPPQFVATLFDAVIPVDSTLSFKYIAVDPDGDNLTFSKIQSPSGATFQPDGIFSWKPTATQLGKDTIIVAVSDGVFTVQDTAIVSVVGAPVLQFSQNNFEFGSINFGGTKTLSATITNGGITPLTLFALPEVNLKPDSNFTFDTTGISFIAPGGQKTISITYHPKSVGGHFAAYVFTTNDPKFQFFTLTANGSAISKLPVTKKVLVDTLHNSPVSFADSTSGVNQLFRFFEQSGIQITMTGSDLRPSGNDILLMIAPQKNFTRLEIDSVKSFVSNGGLLIALGNSAAEKNNVAALNSLLNDASWTTNLVLDSTLVVDSSSNYSDASTPLLTTFVDAKHPFFTNVDTLVFFSSASITVSGTAVPLITTTPLGRTIGAQNITQPVVAALSKIGKGKILLLGDADVWKVKSQDQQNGQQAPPNISVQDNLAFAINVFSVTEDYEVKLPNKTLNERYQLVSIPFDLENAAVGSVLKGLGEHNPLVWRLFGRYDPATLKYAEFPSEKFKSFKRGEGYWLITRGEFGLSLGSATIVPIQAFYPIKIGPGYSMIGNPFPYKVSWKNSSHDSTQKFLWKFDGETFKPESLSLDPFAGYFVKNLSKDSITIYINPDDISSLKKSGYTAAVYTEGEWRVGISASSGKSADKENYAGVAKGANDEFDQYDVAEPPSSPTDYVIVRFQNSSWKQQSGSYAMDIRAVNSEGLFWDVNVITAKAQSSVALNLEQFGNLPNDFAIYVVDKTTERALRIDQTYQYEFTMAKNESVRKLRLVVGKKEYVEKNTEGIPLVAVDYALMQNYPNPFNPSTQIRYTLGHSGHVSLNIYNVLGQHVRLLANAIQPIGTYELEWDGKNNAGINASTGVYFYTITVTSNGEKSFMETKKLMLLK